MRNSDGANAAARFRVHDAIVRALRRHSGAHGLSEFLPPRHVAGFAHIPSQHLVVRADETEIILPYQLSLFNRLAVHFLERPVFCFGPCYRNELVHPIRLKSFYQFSFEIFADDFASLVEHVGSLLRAVWADCAITIPEPVTVDLREPGAPADTEIYEEANRLGRPVLVLYKRRGIDPLLNRLHDDDLEVGLEVVLPWIGEAIDGGLRDPAVLRQIYGVEVTRQTAGASLGIERFAAFIMGTSELHHAELP